MICPYCRKQLLFHQIVIISNITIILCESAPKDKAWMITIPVKVVHPDDKVTSL